MDGSGTWPQYLLAGSGSKEDVSIADNGTSLALTCQQIKNEVGIPLPLSAAVVDGLRYSQIFYYIVGLLFGVLMNSLVIVVVVRFKRLKTATFYLALQVIIVDLINALIIFPSSAANAIAKRNIFTKLCSVLGFAVFFLRAIRTIIMSVLVVDRFCSVFMPYWYPRCRVKVIVTLSVVAWIAALIMSTIPANGLLDCYGFQQYTWACMLTAGCTHQRACLFFDSITVLLTHSSNVVALLLYLSLYCKAKKLRNRVDNVSQFQHDMDARAERQKQERRANVTFFLLFLALLGVSFPSFFFYETSQLLHTSISVDTMSLSPNFQVVIVISRTLYTLLVIVDPMVIIRDRDAREVMLASVAKFKRKIGGRIKEISIDTDSQA